MQLVAYGAQDVYLTGNPQITFFKVVYRRHTNFACESIEQTFNGTVNFGSKVTATVSRNGDLISSCWIEATVTPDAGTQFVNCLGHRLLEEVELEIGGQRIDKHYADWLEIWSELTMPEEKRAGYKAMVGKHDSDMTTTTIAGHSEKLFVPLVFFFNRNPGLALPLIALQYHEVKINVKFAAAAALTSNATPPTDLSASLWVDYVYLDTDERRRFAQVSHEMLIEQLQFTGMESVKGAATNKVRLNFNHPVKELVWVFKDPTGDTADPFDYSYGANQDFTAGGALSNDLDLSNDIMSSAKLQLNGHDRFAERDARYFRLVQPFQHHTRVPTRPVYVYSFALKPEEHQPSGTCNFSRIDNATLNVKLAGSAADNFDMMVFAVSYNVLRIMSGINCYISYLCQTVSLLSGFLLSSQGKGCKVEHAFETPQVSPVCI